MSDQANSCKRRDIYAEVTSQLIYAIETDPGTGAELLLRKALHRAGLRYKLHDKALSGRPDIVLPRFKAVIFVHGCYWHSHGCYRSTKPKSRQKFWEAKFAANRTRDRKNREALAQEGWRVLTVWECALRGKNRKAAG